jgi:hypothetical protein
MEDEGNRPGTTDFSARAYGGRQSREFQPVWIETTYELDHTGLTAREGENLRRRALDIRQGDSLVNTVLGLGAERAGVKFIRVSWNKFGQFPQFISTLRRAGGEEQPAQEVLKETFTRVYQVEPGGEDG